MGEQICVISKHEKGFWMADVYLEGWAEGVSPDWYCCGKIGHSKQHVIDQARDNFPFIRCVNGKVEE